MRFQVRVIGPKKEEKILDLCSTEEAMRTITVAQLKVKIIQEFKTSSDFRVVFGKEQLEDNNTLVSYGIRHMSILHTLLQMPGGL